MQAPKATELFFFFFTTLKNHNPKDKLNPYPALYARTFTQAAAKLRLVPVMR